MWWPLLNAAHAAEVQGFAEVRAAYSVGADGVPWQMIERIRPELSADFSDRVRVSTTVEVAFSQGRRLQTEVQRTIDESDFGPLLELAGCEWPEPPKNEFLGIGDVQSYLRVERLYLDWYHPKFDLRVGRQALNWGSAVLINPTDPFPEVLLTEPWRPRSGVNAVRMTFPVSDTSQLQVVGAMDDALKHGRLAGRGTVNLLDTDVSLVGAYRGDSRTGLLGLDVRGTFGVGFWFEGAVHVGGAKPYEELAVGVDYSVPVLETWVFAAQYYRNGSGDANPTSAVSGSMNTIQPPDCDIDEAEAMFEVAEPDPFAPFTSGIDYGLVQTSLRFTPEIAVSGMMFQNLRDGTGIIVPVAQFKPLDWAEVSLSAQVPYRFGDGGEIKPSDEDLMLNAELPTGGSLHADLSGLAPDAVVSMWVRANF